LEYALDLSPISGHQVRYHVAITLDWILEGFLKTRYPV